MYHDLLPDGEPFPRERQPYVLDPGVFRRQLSIIRRSGFATCTVSEWARAGRHAGTSDVLPPAPCVILTFDDGDQSNHTQALPLLLEAGLTATFFVTVGRLGDAGYLTWDQLPDLQRAGMEIGSHTLTHRPPALLSDAELRYEVVESKKRLEDRLGAPVRSLSSPTGFFNPGMIGMARDAGYSALCTGQIGMVRAGADPFCLPRIPIKRSTGEADFLRILGPSRTYIARLRGQQMVRNGLKRLLGPDRYLRFRRGILGLWTAR